MQIVGGFVSLLSAWERMKKGQHNKGGSYWTRTAADAATTWKREPGSKGENATQTGSHKGTYRYPCPG